MSDFPRGWTLSNQAAGAGTASITVAAIPGVVHVLDSWDAKVSANAAGAALGANITLSSSDGVFAGFVLGQVFATAVNTIDSASGSGLDLAAGPGASLTVTFSVAAVAGDTETLVIQGHDI